MRLALWRQFVLARLKDQSHVLFAYMEALFSPHSPRLAQQALPRGTSLLQAEGTGTPELSTARPHDVHGSTWAAPAF